MLTKRIIPCLDIKDGRTVKGVNFENIRDAGNPVELAVRYCEEGADELVFLDISATNERRKTLLPLVSEIASAINIPFTVGGGITSEIDVDNLLNAGADKVSVNSAAIDNPQLIYKLALHFGSQCVVVAIDTNLVGSDWMVFRNGGREMTDKQALKWAIEAELLGAGEILLTSMQSDGTKQGFALDITSTISSDLKIPVIASGGAGSLEDFLEVFTVGKADAALAASVFHFRELEIPDLKSYLAENRIPVRMVV